MIFLELIKQNLMTLPIFAFATGTITSRLGLARIDFSYLKRVLSGLLLFAIGLKGGVAFTSLHNLSFYFITLILVLWGFILPFCLRWFFERFALLERATATALAASFGSVSVMTYLAGVFFLDKMGLSYDPSTAMILAVMELPAILAAVLMAAKESTAAKVSFARALFHPSIALILAGMMLSSLMQVMGYVAICDAALKVAFKPLLVLFLFLLGISVAQQGQGLKVITPRLLLAAFVGLIVGAAFGAATSVAFSLDVGSALLITLLCASASYIAVPAAMRLLFPSAKESIYLSLSLAAIFPFNVMIGIPLYYVALTAIL